MVRAGRVASNNVGGQFGKRGSSSQVRAGRVASNNVGGQVGKRGSSCRFVQGGLLSTMLVAYFVEMFYECSSPSVRYSRSGSITDK